MLDLGGLRAARGMEMYVVLWWYAARAVGTFDLNVTVEHAATARPTASRT